MTRGWDAVKKTVVADPGNNEGELIAKWAVAYPDEC